MLGALSLLLNGGGVAQLKTIASELNLALEGREGSARSVLRQIEALMGQLDANKGDIVNAIESLNRLAVVGQRADGCHRRRARGAARARSTSLDQQRDDLVKMLKALEPARRRRRRVIKASKESTIESFRQLSPVLTELANSGDDFVNAFHVFLTYPFVDEVVGRDPQVARNLHMGDYTNLSIKLDVDGRRRAASSTLPTNLPVELDPAEIVDDAARRACASGDLDSKACQKVLATPEALLELREECAKPKNEDKDVCKQLNLVPGLPSRAGTRRAARRPAAAAACPHPRPAAGRLRPDRPRRPARAARRWAS